MFYANISYNWGVYSRKLNGNVNKNVWQLRESSHMITEYNGMPSYCFAESESQGDFFKHVLGEGKFEMCEFVPLTIIPIKILRWKHFTDGKKWSCYLFYKREQLIENSTFKHHNSHTIYIFPCFTRPYITFLRCSDVKLLSLTHLHTRQNCFVDIQHRWILARSCVTIPI